MTTDIDAVLLRTMHEFLMATAPGVVEDVGDRDRITLALVCLGIGVQWALELGQLDPTVAQALITAMHETQPDAEPEHNSQAQIYLRLIRERCR